VNDILRAAALNQTMNTRGWQFAMEMAESAVKEAEEAALNCDDDAKVIGLQKEARAARLFLKNWTARLQQAAVIEQPQEFSSVGM
jgi:Tfp pilus assembly protein PilX